jgi:hypothetical protein
LSILADAKRKMNFVNFGPPHIYLKFCAAYRECDN